MAALVGFLVGGRAQQRNGVLHKVRTSVRVSLSLYVRARTHACRQTRHDSPCHTHAAGQLEGTGIDHGMHGDALDILGTAQS